MPSGSEEYTARDFLEILDCTVARGGRITGLTKHIGKRVKVIVLDDYRDSKREAR